MSRIFIIGATGGIGQRLAPKLLAAGHQVSGLYRKDEQAEALTAQGITPVKGDLMEMDTEDFARAIEGADAVVFSAGAAGSGSERTTKIDGQAPAKVVAAMKSQQIERFYLVSAFPESRRNEAPVPGFEHYMQMNKQADIDVTQSGLAWVILRPGTLKHEEGNGKVSAGWAQPYGDVDRGNVASLLAQLIETPAVKREIIEVTNGDTPVDEAVKRFVD